MTCLNILLGHILEYYVQVREKINCDYGQLALEL